MSSCRRWIWLLRRCKRGQLVGEALLVSLLTCLLVKWLIYDPLGLSFFAPVRSSTEVEVSDIYHAVSQGSSRLRYEERIVVVDVSEDADRAAIAGTLWQVADCHPLAIGVDIIFPEAKEPFADWLLHDAVSSFPGVVLPVVLEDYADGAYRQCTRCFFMPAEGVREGFVNLQAKGEFRKVGSFLPYLSFRGDTLLSLPAAILKEGAPDKFAAMLKRKGAEELINWKPRFIEVIPDSAVAANRELIAGKLVLMGIVDDQADQHWVPVSKVVSGTMIHAYTLATMLNEAYIDKPSESVVRWVSFLLCALLIGINLCFKRGKVDSGDFWVRIIQLVMVLGLLCGGYWLFAACNYCVDFTYLLVLVAFSGWSIDVYMAIKEWLSFGYDKFKEKKDMKRKHWCMGMLFLWFAWGTAKAQKYSVQQVKGTACYRIGNSWQQLRQGDKLAPSSQVRLEEQSKLFLADQGAKVVYVLAEAGSHSVSYWIDVANKNPLELIIGYTANRSADDGTQEVARYVTGVSTRDSVGCAPEQPSQERWNLREDEVMLFFMDDGQKLNAFLARKGMEAAVCIPIPERRRIIELLSSASSGSMNLLYFNTELYELLWKPLESYLNRGDNIYYQVPSYLQKILMPQLPINASERMGQWYQLVDVAY